MHTLCKILLPVALLVACDREDTDNAEPRDAAVAAQDDDDNGHRGRRGHHGKGKDPAKRAAHMLDKFDADKDGALTPAEVAQHPHFAGKFAELDADKDGKLTPGELQAMKGRGEERGHGRHDMDPAERAAKALERFDADKDGALSVAEVADHPRLSGHFAEIDGDRDGKLSAAELTAFKAARGERRGHGPDGERGRGRGHGPGGKQGHG